MRVHAYSRKVREPKSEASQRVGDLVRRTRERATMSRSRLAQLSGIDVSHLARIEQGQGNPTLFALIQLATALDVEVELFVAGLNASHLPESITPMSEKQWLRAVSHRND